jgi:cellulose synthase/poly-beta-1,6-N-acetylglucosamine synthase-like glycosyltransferase
MSFLLEHLSVAGLVLFLGSLILLKWCIFLFAKLAPKQLKGPFSSQINRVYVYISIRNESHNIDTLIPSLMLQNYPPHLFRVFIGDDRSHDDGIEKLEQYKKIFPALEIVSFKGSNIEGKASVLQHLYEKNQDADYLMFTDADMHLPPQWITYMVSIANEKRADLVTGISLPVADSVFSQMQTFEWYSSLSAMGLFAMLGNPLSAMGNNMLISKNAFKEVNGFKGLEKHPTEDLALFQRIKKAGKTVIQLHHRDHCLATTNAMQSIESYLQQRIRWMAGVFDEKKYFALFIILEHLQALAFATVCILHLEIGFYLLVIELVSQVYMVHQSTIQLKRTLFSSVLSSFILYITKPASLLYYVVNRKNIIWKGRIIER